MRISELTKQVLDYVHSDEESDHLNEAYIYKTMDFTGENNKHLMNPLNSDPNVYYLRPREVPFNGEENIEGNLFLFIDSPHDMITRLVEMKSLEEIESLILSGGGITNPFIGCMVAIVNGKVKAYEVSYLDEKAGARKVFSKKEQYTDERAFRDYGPLELKWL